jgi:hypothetical protein
MQKDVMMPEEAANLMTERIELWRSYDESNQHALAIAALTQKVGQIMKSEEVAHLLPLPSGRELPDSSNPPDELRTTHHSIKQEIGKIEVAQSQIDEKDAEITRLENQKNMIIGVFIIGVIVVALIAVLILASMLGII